MKRALAVSLLTLAGAVALFFLWPETHEEPVRGVAEGAYSPAPSRTTGSAIVRPGRAHEAAGRVVDAGGRGIPHAQVFVAHENAASMADEGCDCPVCRKVLLECGCPGGAAQVGQLVQQREGELQPDQTTQADADGSFRIPEPPSGPFLIWATAPGYAPAFRHGVVAGKRIELTLGMPQAVWGTVVDESERPVPDALVTAVSAMLPRFAEASPAPDGSFRIDGLGLGPHFLVAVAPHHLPAGLAVVLPTGSHTTLTLARARALEGTVRDHRRPVAGAVVRLNADHFARWAPSPQGTFRFEGLAPGTYTVVATVGHRLASAQVELKQLVTHVDLELEEAMAVRGRVFDDLGGPVAGALVIVTVDARRLGETHSEADGSFALDGVPAGARLTASHEGYEPSSAQLGEGGLPVEIVLHAQAIVEGVVVSPQDEPLPQVQVVARGAASGVATSDATGTFRLALPNPGPVTLLAHHSTYGAGEISIEAPARGVRLKLSTMGAVRARLVDLEGRPVPGGRATAWKDDPALQRYDTFSSDVPSGQSGEVVLAGLPSGPHRMRFVAHGYQPAERRHVPVPESGELDLGEVALQAGKEISGVVLKDDGTPAEGAFVHARTKGARASEGIPTGKDGSFVLAGLKDGPYIVSAFLDKAVAEANARAGDRDVVIRLPAGARLRGRVQEADGRPIAHFFVDGASIEAPDGRFEVAARAWRDNVFFRVGAPGHLTAFKQARLDGSGVADGGDVVLERALSIAGVVRDEAGAPVGGAAVRVAEREEIAAQDELPARTVSSADGRFRLDGFAPGPVLLVARRGNLVAEEAVMLEESSAQEVVLTLRGKGAIEGVVRTGDGKPVVAEVHARSSSTTSDALGRYRLDGLVPDRYSVLAVLDNDSFHSATREVEVTAGQTTRLDFDLGAGATLRVIVEGATQGSLHLSRMEGASPGAVRATQTAVVNEGRATLAGLPEGRYSVVFFGVGAKGPVTAVSTAEVPATGSAQLLLTAHADEE